MAQTNSNTVTPFYMGPYAAPIVLNVTRFCHKDQKNNTFDKNIDIRRWLSELVICLSELPMNMS